jgi:hypothetical protein
MIEKTKRLLFLSGLMQVPFIALNLMLDVMLSKHFDATAVQISFITTLRPVLAVFAFYWGSVLLFRPQYLRLSLVIATVGATSLFLFVPWATSIWYFIVAESCYVLFLRAATPAQMEVLKVSVDPGAMKKIFSQSLSLSRAAAIIIGPLLGLFLFYYPWLWKELFALVALLYIASGWVKGQFSVPPGSASEKRSIPPISAKEFFVTPWKESFRLLKSNKAFLQFQLGFFIAGSGLMFAKPTIPGFLRSLDLSFFEIFSLFTLLEGLGFILSSSLWAKYLARVGLHRAASFIAILFSFQPLLFIVGVPGAVFAAYFIYGIAQAGSTLVWNLSGPLLCGKESSSQYTAVNILAVGVRGCFVPLMGALCTELYSIEISLLVSFSCMLCGAYYLWSRSAAFSTEVGLNKT